MILSSREEIRKIGYRVPKVPTTLNIVINCHMIFYVIMVTFLMTLLMNNFTAIPTYFSSSKCQILQQPLVYYASITCL
jgi:hypothetical protein